MVFQYVVIVSFRNPNPLARKKKHEKRKSSPLWNTVEEHRVVVIAGAVVVVLVGGSGYLNGRIPKHEMLLVEMQHLFPVSKLPNSGV